MPELGGIQIFELTFRGRDARTSRCRERLGGRVTVEQLPPVPPTSVGQGPFLIFYLCMSLVLVDADRARNRPTGSAA